MPCARERRARGGHALVHSGERPAANRVDITGAWGTFPRPLYRARFARPDFRNLSLIQEAPRSERGASRRRERQSGSYCRRGVGEGGSERTRALNDW